MADELVLQQEMDDIMYSVRVTPMGEIKDKEDLNARGRLFKNALKGMGYLEIMGKYFDKTRRVEYKQHGLEVWPGYFTALKIRENQLFVEVDLCFKIIRKQTLLEYFKEQVISQDKEKVKDELIG